MIVIKKKVFKYIYEHYRTCLYKKLKIINDKNQTCVKKK